MRHFDCTFNTFLRAAAMSLPFVYGAIVLAAFAPATLHAQSMLAGDIAGTVLGTGAFATDRRSHAV